MSGTLVSVIIPFYNAERFLGEAVESVLAQTHEQWELLLVDDGSTDGSSAIARAYAERLPSKIRCLDHSDRKNHGVCHSRNLGIRNSRGKFVALLDADDVWLPNKLQRQLSILNMRPEAGAVFGRSEYWYDWTGDPADLGKNCVPPVAAADRLYTPPELLAICHPIGTMGAPCPSDLLLRREVIERIGGFEEAFDRGFQAFEDQAFLAKLYLNTAVFVSSECWDRYRRREDSCWSVALRTGTIERAARFYFGWLREYLAVNAVTDAAIGRAVDKAAWRYRHPRVAAWVSSAHRLARPFRRGFQMLQGA